MVWDIVEASWPATGEVGLPQGQRPIIMMSPRVRQAMNLLREFMFQRVYNAEGQSQESKKAREVLELLYHHFCQDPSLLPEAYRQREQPVERAVVDYIAGMTDNYAISVAERIRPGITQGVFGWRV